MCIASWVGAMPKHKRDRLTMRMRSRLPAEHAFRNSCVRCCSIRTRLPFTIARTRSRFDTSCCCPLLRHCCISRSRAELGLTSSLPLPLPRRNLCKMPPLVAPAPARFEPGPCQLFLGPVAAMLLLLLFALLSGTVSRDPASSCRPGLPRRSAEPRLLRSPMMREALGPFTSAWIICRAHSKRHDLFTGYPAAYCCRASQ
jgi:hypothetical protein